MDAKCNWFVAFIFNSACILIISYTDEEIGDICLKVTLINEKGKFYIKLLMGEWCAIVKKCKFSIENHAYDI